jgi:hypothetical protein
MELFNRRLIWLHLTWLFLRLTGRTNKAEQPTVYYPSIGRDILDLDQTFGAIP